jgi:hypothetical protein
MDDKTVLHWHILPQNSFKCFAFDTHDLTFVDMRKDDGFEYTLPDPATNGRSIDPQDIRYFGYG